jgi:hypothetical protein
MQLSVAVRNAVLNAIEATVGTDAVLMVREGAAPATVASTDTGAVLASMTLPTDWMAAAAVGAKALAGTWSDTDANASGTPGHYRIYASDGTTQHIQGTCSNSSDSELILDAATIAAGQTVTVTAYNLTAGNA